MEGDFNENSAVEVVDEKGEVFAKGLCQLSTIQLKENSGRKTSEVSPDLPNIVIHRDDLVVLV